MKRYRFAVALLCGTGFTCLVALLLGLSPSAPLSVLLFLCLAPGGIIADLVLNTNEFATPVALLAANSLVYSAISFVGLSISAPAPMEMKMRVATMKLVFPVALLLGLVCIPHLNPLWPQGMSALTMQEAELRQALPLGMLLDTARDALRSKGIEFAETTEGAKSVVFDGGKHGRVVASAGDHVLSAQRQTAASEFPCGYRIEIVLVFSPDGKMSQQYIHRFPLCP